MSQDNPNNPQDRKDVEFKAIRAVLELNGYTLRKQRDKLIYDVLNDSSQAARGSVFLDASNKWVASDFNIDLTIKLILSIRIS